MKTRIKLSTKQKEVIKLMREGYKLHWRPFEYYFYKNGKLIEFFLPYKEMTAFVDELCKIDIIESMGRDPGIKQYFILTELGKTINIDV